MENWRGRFQESEVRAGRAVPVFLTQFDDSGDENTGWIVRVLCSDGDSYTSTWPLHVAPRKRDAERRTAECLYHVRHNDLTETQQRDPNGMEMSETTMVLPPSLPTSLPPPLRRRDYARSPALCSNTAPAPVFLSARQSLPIRPHGTQFQLVVLVDVDNSHWAVHQASAARPDVYYVLYASCGTNPPWPTLPAREHEHYTICRMEQPGKDLVDAAMTLDVAQWVVLLPRASFILVSRDNALYNASVLLGRERVQYAADPDAFRRHLQLFEQASATNK